MHLRIIFLLLLILCEPVLAGTLRRGLGPEPDSLHIHQAQGLSSIHLLREIREGLVTYDVNGEPAPGVARSWDISNGDRTYRFHLREDARWSNGDPVSAADFVRAWRSAVSPTTAARNASLMGAVENAGAILAGDAAPETLGVTALTDHVLEVRLVRPLPWFLEILAHPVTYPLHSLDPDSPRQAIVNGAFMIDEMTPHALIRLVKNPYFHAAGSVKLDVLELFPIEEPPAELSRYRADELHITETIPPGRYDWLRDNLGSELRVAPYLGSFWLGLNHSREPFRNNLNLRKALSLALDRETLVRVVLGAGEQPAWSIMPPGLSKGRSLQAPLSSQPAREQEARRLFARSGYDRRNPLRVELRYNTSSQHRRMAVAVSAMWKQVLGVSTVLINEEWKVFVNNRSQGVLTQAFRGGWIADFADPTSFLDLFRSSDAMNWGRYYNADYDTLLDQAAELSGAGRMERLREAETLLMRDMPVIPLYYYVSRHLVKPGVSGFNDNVRDIHLSRYLDIDTEAH